MRLNISITKKGSIEKAIKELERYKREFHYKVDEFVRRLAYEGIDVARQTLAFEGTGDAPRSANFGIFVDDNGEALYGMVKAEGEGLLFWEFGAGNLLNSTDHPKAGEFGMGPGTYPGQTHVPHPGFWYYYDKDGEAIRSIGTQATMPMLKASMEMQQKVVAIAKEVFK